MTNSCFRLCAKTMLVQKLSGAGMGEDNLVLS
jgi:hypothetical protein